jgi:phage shock protein PspC (stress-responsive transcriptional regulator)
MNRRLYRCRENRVIAGVASGVAEYLGLDPTLVRVLWFLSIFFGGVTLVVYIGLALIVPLEPLSAEAAAAAAASGEGAGHGHAPRGNGIWTTIFGIALMLLGGLALIGVLLPDVHAWKYLGPLFLIGMGAVLVVAAMRRRGQVPPAVTPPQEPTNS